MCVWPINHTHAHEYTHTNVLHENDFKKPGAPGLKKVFGGKKVTDLTNF